MGDLGVDLGKSRRVPGAIIAFVMGFLKIKQTNLEGGHACSLGGTPTATAVISVPQAGEILGLSRAAAYREAARGNLPVIRFGRSLRVSLASVEAMLSGGSEPAANDLAVGANLAPRNQADV